MALERNRNGPSDVWWMDDAAAPPRVMTDDAAGVDEDAAVVGEESLIMSYFPVEMKNNAENAMATDRNFCFIIARLEDDLTRWSLCDTLEKALRTLPLMLLGEDEVFCEASFVDSDSWVEVVPELLR